MSIVALRSATAADSEFCFQLHKAAMGEYVQAIWGWDEQVQRDYHNRGFAPGQWQIITVEGTDVGMLSVEYRQTETYLARIEVQPSHQGQGIGSRIVQNLLDHAAKTSLPVVLDVLVVNHRAQALYHRLGFVQTAQHGPDNIKIRMSATPAESTAGASACQDGLLNAPGE
jgi:ribosomal protein S18 acetylase RimI-like enzyme